MGWKPRVWHNEASQPIVTNRGIWPLLLKALPIKRQGACAYNAKYRQALTCRERDRLERY